MPNFEDLLSFSDAAKKWNLNPATLRRAVEYGRLKPNLDCKLFGHQWIVTKESMVRLFGEQPINLTEEKRNFPVDNLPCDREDFQQN